MRRGGDIAVIAVDGGGTRCRIALWDGKALTSVETGPANASTDADRAIREVLEGLKGLSGASGRTVDDLIRLPAFVGLAGVVDDDIADRLRQALPFEHVRIADDRPAAVRGVLGHADGVLGHCGTGSFHAAQIGGEIRLSGGWGSKLGDEASAQWVGRSALSLALRSSDGRRASSELTRHLLSEFDGPSGIVGFAADASPQDFGSLAPLVTRCAAEGDETARQIMMSGANDIADGLRALGWNAGMPIFLTGGIGPHYAPFLPNDMQADITEGQGEPLDGALSLARDFAEELRDASS